MVSPDFLEAFRRFAKWATDTTNYRSALKNLREHLQNFYSIQEKLERLVELWSQWSTIRGTTDNQLKELRRCLYQEILDEKMPIKYRRLEEFLESISPPRKAKEGEKIIEPPKPELEKMQPIQPMYIKSVRLTTKKRAKPKSLRYEYKLRETETGTRYVITIPKRKRLQSKRFMF